MEIFLLIVPIALLVGVGAIAWVLDERDRQRLRELKALLQELDNEMTPSVK